MIYADHDSVFNFDLQSITIEIKKKDTSKFLFKVSSKFLVIKILLTTVFMWTLAKTNQFQICILFFECFYNYLSV